MKASNTTVPLFTEVGFLIKNRLQKALPLPLAQCQTLGFVAEHPRPNMQDVARYFKITAPSATFLVEELVRGGYLTRRTNARDRRKIELVLTTKGKGAFKTLTHTRSSVLEHIFGHLSSSDRGELNRILGKIIKGA